MRSWCRPWWPWHRWHYTFITGDSVAGYTQARACVRLHCRTQQRAWARHFVLLWVKYPEDDEYGSVSTVGKG